MLSVSKTLFDVFSHSSTPSLRPSAALLRNICLFVFLRQESFNGSTFISLERMRWKTSLIVRMGHLPQIVSCDVECFSEADVIIIRRM